MTITSRKANVVTVMVSVMCVDVKSDFVNEQQICSYNTKLIS